MDTEFFYDYAVKSYKIDHPCQRSRRLRQNGSTQLTRVFLRISSRKRKISPNRFSLFIRDILYVKNFLQKWSKIFWHCSFNATSSKENFCFTSGGNLRGVFFAVHIPGGNLLGVFFAVYLAEICQEYFLLYTWRKSARSIFCCISCGKLSGISSCSPQLENFAVTNIRNMSLLLPQT